MKSIRWKLVLSFFLLSAVTLVLTGSLLLASTRTIARRLELQDLRQTAVEILPGVQRMLAGEVDQARIRTLIEVAESLGNVDLRFVGPEGEVDASDLLSDRRMQHPEQSMRLPRSTQAPHPEVLDFAQRIFSGEPGRIIDGPPGRPGNRNVSVRVPGNGSSYLEILGRGSLTEDLTRLTGIGFAVSAVVTLVASALMGLAVASGLTRPVVELGSVVDRMAAGDMNARADLKSHDEIGALGSRFNQMADRLGESIAELNHDKESLRGFLADASHELRTPLTALTAFIELMRTQPSRQSELLEDMDTQTRRMSRTVADLLLLSRLDGGIGGSTAQSVSVQEAVEEAWTTVSSGVGTDQKMEVSGEVVVISGNRAHLVILIENILENAVNAGGPGSVYVDVGSDRTTCSISVTDDGPGIPPDLRERIFDRFFRAPGTEYEGSGLGLAIARSIARSHGGDITADSPASDPRVAGEPGTRMIITLPLDPSLLDDHPESV